MTPPDRLRLFVAASLPRPLLERLERATSTLRERWPSARWAPVPNQHVTLKFLGWVDRQLVDPLRETVAGVADAHQPADLQLTALGVFPGPTRARVLWAGLDDPDDLLGSVAGALDDRCKKLGFAPEARPFRSHLTIARFKQPVRVGRDLPLLDLGEERGFRLDTIELFRSHLSPHGARYEVLEAFPLGGPARL